MRIGFRELPDGTTPRDASWARLSERVAAEVPELMVMNETPFGPWLAAGPEADPARAAASVNLHKDEVAALCAMRARAVIASAPVLSGDLREPAWFDTAVKVAISSVAR